MKRIWFNSITLFSLTLPSAALAHPGHGSDGGGNGLLHYLTEPAHVVPAVLLVAAVLIARYCIRAAHKRSRL